MNTLAVVALVIAPIALGVVTYALLRPQKVQPKCRACRPLMLSTDSSDSPARVLPVTDQAPNRPSTEMTTATRVQRHEVRQLEQTRLSGFVVEFCPLPGVWKSRFG